MRRSKRFVAVLLTTFVAALAPTAGCGGSNELRQAGIACSSDGECAAGLSCLGLGNGSGSACTTIARACTKSCMTDLDCLAVGSGYRCLPSCQTAGTCVQTKSVGD